jgi:4'-phosphopantetheinyl transferase
VNEISRRKLILAENEAHLWVTKPQMCHNSELLDRYKNLLMDSETKKQQRYVFEKDRHDALITRAFIRDLLSYYIDIPASEWRFSYTEKGKPEIINPPIPLRFNISHTKKLIICAVTLINDIGCDVEHVERKTDVLAIADRYFSKLETAELFSLPTSLQRQRFFDYWTLKESYIKAWGEGLSIPLSDFSFHIASGEEDYQNSNIHLSFSPDREDDAALWRSWLFYPGTEHRIALSIKNIASESGAEKPKGGYTLRFFDSVPLISCQEMSSQELCLSDFSS